MTTGFIIGTVIDVVLAGAVVLAVLFEKNLIDFEEKIADRIEAKRVAKQGDKAVIICPQDFSHCA